MVRFGSTFFFLRIVQTRPWICVILGSAENTGEFCGLSIFGSSVTNVATAGVAAAAAEAMGR